MTTRQPNKNTWCIWYVEQARDDGTWKRLAGPMERNEAHRYCSRLEGPVGTHWRIVDEDNDAARAAAERQAQAWMDASERRISQRLNF